jgi:serine/threonine protein phosphatase PrpC
MPGNATGGGSTCVHCGGAIDDAQYCTDCGRKQPSVRDHLELEAVGAAGVTDRGQRHPRNEDAFALGVGPGSICTVVCDGVSTAPLSDLASQAACDAALVELTADRSSSGSAGGDIPGDLDDRGGVGDDERIVRATAAAQQAASAVSADRADKASCTYVAAIWRRDVATIGWVGDSRAYLVDVRGSRRLTSDDSWAQHMVDTGQMSEPEAMADNRAHQITRWLGGDAVLPVLARTVVVDTSAGGRLVVCSDGLWNYLSNDADLLALGPLDGSPLAVARRMVEFANAAGGHDNITVVVIDLPSGAAAHSNAEGEQ